MKPNAYTFTRAIPVWERGTQTEMNRTVSFVTTLKKEAGSSYTLCVAASSIYLLTINGRFVASGPARAGHGYYRVDEWSLDEHLTKGDNVIALRVTGYNVNSFYTLDVPAFVCAEIRKDGQTVAFTDARGGGFVAYAGDGRVQKTHRYSFQRAFSEAYRLSADTFGYENGQGGPAVLIEATEQKNFIPRELPYGEFETLRPIKTVQHGRVSYGGQAGYDDRSLRPTAIFKTYDRGELEYDPAAVVSTLEYEPLGAVERSVEAFTVPADCYLDLDFGRNQTGIFELDIESDGGECYLLFDEMLTDGQINCRRMGDVTNYIALITAPGRAHLITAEPYALRYLRVVAKGTNVTVRDLRLHRVAFPRSQIQTAFVGEEPVLKSIYDAAVETFAANAVDVFSDCPSRERAGWLCDSFFTSRVEYALTGQSRVERAFLQNFLMPEHFDHLPAGMLPMCYPADHTDGVFIPNWAMWYVLELEEYLSRTGDAALIADAKERVYGLLAYFRAFENTDGLLEKLASWVFVEWSHANELTQDVNYPTNMLYARMKDAIAHLYGDGALSAEAAAMRRVILEQSFNGTFFCDNAYRRDGKLTPSGECTEVCQYYAFFFDIATPESHPDLWQTLLRDFGYARRKTGKYPAITHANAFIGNYLRLDLLDRYGYREELLDNIRGYFAYMADTTGTLWEHDAPSASCNHGFASHVAYWLKKQGLVR